MGQNDIILTQEKWNMILDLKDQNQKQQDELDRLRRMYRALDEKYTEVQVELMKLNSNASFTDIFGPRRF